MTTLTITYHAPAEAGEPQTDEAVATLDRLNTTAWLEQATRNGYIVARHWHTKQRLYIPWHRVVSISEGEAQP